VCRGEVTKITSFNELRVYKGVENAIYICFETYRGRLYRHEQNYASTSNVLKKNHIQYIYFDVDDTLLDHKSAEKAGLIETRETLGFLQEVSPGRLIDTYHSNNARLWKDYGVGLIERPFLEESRFSWTLRDLGIPPHNWQIMRDEYMKNYEKHWTWVDGAHEALGLLSGRYPVGFLTNGFSEIQQRKAERFDLMLISENYIISEDVGFMKPMPGIFEFATRLAGVQPGNILYVGDSYISDITGGANYGWKTAWYNPTGKADIDKLADLDFKSFKELENFLGV
jgi:HAD superfamily hydrolase (TIGR01549 family)